MNQQGQDREHCQTLLKHFRHRLTEWELEFLRSLEGRLSSSPKQRAALDRIVTTYLGRGLTVGEKDLW